MIKKVRSFPFFTIIVGMFYYTTIFGQNKTDYRVNDSLIFYHELVHNPKTIDDIRNSIDYFSEYNKNHINKRSSIDANIYALINLSQAQLKLKFLNDSEISIMKSLQLLESHNIIDSLRVNRYRSSIFNHIGKIYREREDYNSAIEFYNQQLSRSNNISSKAVLLNNLGFAYQKLGEYDLALKNFEQAYKLSLRNNDSVNLARTIDNMGILKMKQNDTISLSHLKRALKIRKDIGYERGVFTSYIHLGYYFNKRDVKDSVLFYINRVKQLAEKTNNPIFLREASLLKLTFNNDRDFITYKRIDDSIENFENQSRNKYAILKYSQEKEIVKTKRQKMLKFIFLALIIIILILSILMFYVLKFKYQKEKVEQVLETEMRISKKVHDDVANGTYQLMAKLQSKPQSNETLLDDLEIIYNKARDISKENALIDTNSDFLETLNDLVSSFKAKHIVLVTKDFSKINWDLLTKLQKATIYKVIQELLINMKKHSHATNVALYAEQKNKHICIVYKDNGIGCRIKKSGGLLNMENRMQSINGNIIFESEPDTGFKSIITI